MIGKTNAVCGTPDGGNSDRRTYFGTGADGDLHITAAQTYTVNVVEDSESAILNLKSLVIDEGGVLTTSGRCQGLFVKVDGDCTINGTINMDKKAPREAVNDAELAQNPCIVLCGNPVGGTGGSGGTNTESQSYTRYYGGSGGTGYVFGGGSGGGGASLGMNGSDGTRAPVGVTWPYKNVPPLYGSGGGASSTAGGAAPGGGGYNQGSNDGDAYGGGAIYLFVYGALTIGSTGRLTANGGNGAAGKDYHYSSTGYSNSTYSGSGGGGGGGVICIVYNAEIVQDGQLSVAGGISTSYTSNIICTGTSGSVGTTMTAKFETLQK